MVRVTQLSVTRQVKEAWYELSFIERSLDINNRLRDIISQILHVAETRYANGEGLQQDILMAQVQLSELIDRDVSLKAMKTKQQDTIGSLRITSYNVCYTKLLRIMWIAEVLLPASRTCIIASAFSIRNIRMLFSARSIFSMVEKVSRIASMIVARNNFV